MALFRMEKLCKMKKSICMKNSRYKEEMKVEMDEKMCTWEKVLNAQKIIKEHWMRSQEKDRKLDTIAILNLFLSRNSGRRSKSGPNIRFTFFFLDKVTFSYSLRHVKASCKNQLDKVICLKYDVIFILCEPWKKMIKVTNILRGVMKMAEAIWRTIDNILSFPLPGIQRIELFLVNLQSPVRRIRLSLKVRVPITLRIELRGAGGSGRELRGCCSCRTGGWRTTGHVLHGGRGTVQGRAEIQWQEKNKS